MRQTRVQQGLSPVWNETFEFPVGSQNIIRIVLCEKKAWQNEFHGFVDIELDHFKYSSDEPENVLYHDWMELGDGKGEQVGSIHV